MTPRDDGGATAGASLPAALVAADAVNIDDVVGRLEAICAGLPAADGVRCFAAMYLVVTQGVQSSIASDFFTSSQFLTELDVRFANRFFDAVSSAAQGRSCSRAWQALFDRRVAGDVSALQFALAGMNAHINFDLAQAVVDTLDAIGADPDDQRHHDDFVRVNVLLDRLEPQIRATMEQHGIPTHPPGPADRFADFGIADSREAAWRTAQALWRIRHDHRLRQVLTGALDDAVTLSSEALLAGLPWVHPRAVNGLKQ